MHDNGPERSASRGGVELVDKPLNDMTQDEYNAWYRDYMKSVPESNIMLISGVPIEIEPDHDAFNQYVIVFQQLRRQGMV